MPGTPTAGAEESGFGEQFQDAQETLANQQAPSDPINERTSMGAVPLDFLSGLPRLDISKTLTPICTGSMAAPSPGGAAGVTGVEPARVAPCQNAGKEAEEGTPAEIRLAPLQTGFGKSPSPRTAAPKNEPRNKEEKEADSCFAVIVPQPAEVRATAGKPSFTDVSICPAQPAVSDSSSIPEEVPAEDVPEAKTPKRIRAGVASPLPVADARGSERTQPAAGIESGSDVQASKVQAVEVQPVDVQTIKAGPIQFSEDASSPLGKQQAAAPRLEALRTSSSTSLSDIGATPAHPVMDVPSEIEGIRGKRGTSGKDPGMPQIRFTPAQQTAEPKEMKLPAVYAPAISPEPAASQGIPAQTRAAEAYAAQPGVPVKSASQETAPTNGVMPKNVAGQFTSAGPRDKADLAISVSARPKAESEPVETLPKRPFGQLATEKQDRPAAVQETEFGQVHSSAVRPTIWSFAGPPVNRETQPPAAEPNQRPMNTLPEMDRIRATEATTVNSSGPLRNISLHVGQVGQPKVEVQVTERSGEVHVAVRSGDSEMVRGLRHDLPELVNRLENSGFTATAWRPSGEIGAASQSSEPQQGSSEHRGQQPDSQSGGSHSSHDQRSHRHPNSQQWTEEFEDINNDFDRLKGELHGFSR